MGEKARIALAITALVVATIIWVSAITPNVKWCDNGWAGFGCDAWIQAISQFLGAVATLAAVTLTLLHVRSQETEARSHRLLALSHELGDTVERITRTFASMERARRILDAPHTEDQARYEFHALHQVFSQVPRIKLVIYPTVVAEVAYLPPPGAAQTLRAIRAIGEWNVSFSEFITSTMPGLASKDLNDLSIRLGFLMGNSMAAIDFCNSAMVAISAYAHRRA